MHWTCPPINLLDHAAEDPALLARYRPACAPLLRAPVAVLRDRARWPSHLCSDLLRESTERWAAARGVPEPTRAEWLSLWPLPVGRRAWDAQATQWAISAPELATPALPFPGHERAALILTLDLDDHAISFFGLVAPVVDPATLAHAPGDPADWAWRLAEEHPDQVTWRLDRASFLVRGPDPTRADVRQLIDAARRWWAPFIGQAVAPGRPVGSRTYPTRESFLTAFGPAVRELRKRYGRDPMATEVLRYLRRNGHLVIDPSQFATWRRNLGWPTWADFLAEVKE